MMNTLTDAPFNEIKVFQGFNFILRYAAIKTTYCHVDGSALQRSPELDKLSPFCLCFWQIILHYFYRLT